MTCRFCRGDERSTEHTSMMKYSTRSLAHTDCLITAKGEAFVLALPIGWLGRASVMSFSRAGQKQLMAMVTKNVRREWPR